MIGLYARLQNGAQKLLPATEQVRVPLLAALRERPRAMLLCTGIAFGYVTIAYIGSTFFLAYATQIGYDSSEALLFDIAMSVAIVISAPLFASLSDQLGRRRVMILGAAIMSLGFFLFFPLVGLHSLFASFAAYIMVGAFMGATQGPIPAFLAEQFPQAMRYSGMSAAYQIGAALGGGTASSAATAILIANGNDPFGVSLYGAFALAIVALCSWQLRETAHLSLADLDSSEPTVAPCPQH